MDAIATKECRRCNAVKPVSQMKRDGRNGDKYSSFCKACHATASVAWQSENREHVKETRRLRYQRKNSEITEQRRAKYDSETSRWGRRWTLYKATKEWYLQTLAQQGGGCAICGAIQDT